MQRLVPATWTQGDLAARLAAEGGRNCTSNTLSMWRTAKREHMTESQRAAVLVLLPKLEAEARAVRVSAMAEARRLAAEARDRRQAAMAWQAAEAKRVAEAAEARRLQEAREAAWRLEERKRLDEENRLKQVREHAARLERAERERWASVQSVDLELVAPHGLWAVGEHLLVDRRPLELRVRIRDHHGTCTHPPFQYIYQSIGHPCTPSRAPTSTRELWLRVRIGRCALTPLAGVGPHTRARGRHLAAAERLVHRRRVRWPRQ